MAYCALEALLELLVGIFATEEQTLGAAPTQQEASQGINVDGAKSLSIRQLFKVLL